MKSKINTIIMLKIFAFLLSCEKNNTTKTVRIKSSNLEYVNADTSKNDKNFIQTKNSENFIEPKNEINSIPNQNDQFSTLPNDLPKTLDVQPGAPAEDANVDVQSGGLNTLPKLNSSNTENDGVDVSGQVILVNPDVAIKDNCVALNREAGDPYRYDFCTNKNDHLTAEEKITVEAIVSFIKITLNISNCSCPEIYNQLSQVKDIDLSNKKITTLLPLSALMNLEKLLINKNEIKDLDDIQKFKNLKILNIGENKLTNIDALGNHPALESLGISDNLISNISSLISIKKIKIIDAKNNQITSIASFNDKLAGGGFYIDYRGNPGIKTQWDTLKSNITACSGTMDGLHATSGSSFDPVECLDADLTNSLNSLSDF